MMLDTARGVQIDSAFLNNYLQNLVNLFFKILPMRENGEKTINVYMESLQAELIGCERLIAAIQSDAMYLSLINILQFLLDNTESDVSVYKREVFKAISICNKLTSKYALVSRTGGERI